MKTFSGRQASQHEFELRSFIGTLRDEGVRTYLEIGARHGDTFHEVMCSLPRGALGVAVDLPGGEWGKAGTEKQLGKAVRDLRTRGYRVHSILGDSTTIDIIARVKALGPFDAALIDGDHRYAGVLADWQNYGPLAPRVAFHDIWGVGVRQRNSGALVEVPRLWAELREQYRHREWIERDPARPMGIGLLWTGAAAC